MTPILATPPECTRPSAARALMDEAGIAWRLHVRLGETAEEIVALARELGSQGIATGRTA